MYKKALRNPFLVFLPFLLFYSYYIILNKWPSLYGDEIRYVEFAHNLIHGFYSPAAPHINLWNGPGYPLLIWPFIAWKVPVLYITLLNAVYQYLALVLFYKALKLVSNHKTALFFSLMLAIYPNALSVLPILYTEAFTTLLISALVYAVTLSFTKNKMKYAYIAGVILGCLTLTKVIFGYVLVICLGACLLALLSPKRRIQYLKAVKILLIALAVTLPYLAYTWQITGKAFYWGNSGGMSLYWMSSPYEGEYGDWKVPYLTNNQYPTLYKSAETAAILKKNHTKEMSFILKHNEIARDALFKQAAISNIKAHPFKFLQNYYYNFSRMLFNFPYSYAYQDGAIVGNIIRGSLILWASIAAIILTVINRRRISFAVKFMLLVSGVYLALTGALSAYPRQLDVMVPVLLFWLGYLTVNMPIPKLRFADDDNLDDIDLNDLNELNLPANEVAENASA